MDMTFVDAKDRTIVIEGDDDIEAFHEGRQIGRIEFDSDEFGPRLYGMNINLDYRQAGIGTEMMRAAAELHGKRFRKASLLAVGGHHVPSEDYFTQEGAALIQRCIRLGILEDTESPERDDDNDY